MKISNIHKNIMGTTSFNAKFKGMRKEQDFIVYPINEDVQFIKIQSDNRIGKVCIETGLVQIATAKVFAAFSLSKIVDDRIDNIEELRSFIRSTASAKAGSNGVCYCDNSKAASL